MITACIGVMILLALATLWMNRKSALADALATKNVLELANPIVNEHAAELSTCRQLLMAVGTDGRVDDSKWLEERDFFIERIIEPQAGEVHNSLDRLLAVWQMIDDATAEFASSRGREPFAPHVPARDRTHDPSTSAATCAA